jgi:hypothetical protein
VNTVKRWYLGLEQGLEQHTTALDLVLIAVAALCLYLVIWGKHHHKVRTLLWMAVP